INKKLITKIPSNKSFKKLPLYYYYTQNDDFLNIKADKIDKSYVNLNFFTNHHNSEHEYKVKLDLVLRMLNDISEGIKKDIRLKKSLVYGGGFHYVFNDKEGGVYFETECDAENINELLSTIANYLDNLSKSGFTAEQLTKAKREIQYAEDTKEPRASKNMSKLYDYKYFGKILNHDKMIKLAKSLTIEDCNTVFNDIFMNNKVALSIYGNADKSKIINKREFNRLFRSH
ncbi:MAG: insulinase family protein, partial [Clostridia bacterium]